MSNQANKADNYVVTGKVRFSYANLFEPRAVSDDQDKKYSLCVLIPKSDVDTLRKIKAAVEAAKQTGISKWGGKIPASLKTPLRDGDIEKPDSPEYAGHYFLNASNKRKPGIVDRRRNEILDQTEVYSGCYGRVGLEFYPFSVKVNNGIAVSLMTVQKLADGEPLGGRRSTPEEDFDIEDDGGEDDFLS